MIPRRMGVQACRGGYDRCVVSADGPRPGTPVEFLRLADGHRGVAGRLAPSIDHVAGVSSASLNAGRCRSNYEMHIGAKPEPVQ